MPINYHLTRNELDSMFPNHKASLHLTHNDHKSCYETVEQHTQHFDWEDDWVSDEQKKKSLETQELWELQWYPSTPISFYHVMGADLGVVLSRALEIEKQSLLAIQEKEAHA